MSEPTTPTGVRLFHRRPRLAEPKDILAIEEEAGALMLDLLTSHVLFANLDDLACSCGWEPRNDRESWGDHLRKVAEE